MERFKLEKQSLIRSRKYIDDTLHKMKQGEWANFLATWFHDSELGFLLQKMQPCLGLNASVCMAHLTNSAILLRTMHSGNSNSSINEIKIP